MLQSERLTLRMGESADVPAVVGFYTRNRTFLEPFEPARVPAFYSNEYWLAQLRRNQQEFLNDLSLRLLLFPRDGSTRVLGTVNFTGFVRGAAQSCLLGYSLDESEQGKGLMGEALRQAIPYVHGELNFHRISANYMPHNQRSGRVLEHLGFAIEGHAKDYLMIGGRWQDHVLTSLINPGWKPVA